VRAGANGGWKRERRGRLAAGSALALLAGASLLLGAGTARGESGSGRAIHAERPAFQCDAVAFFEGDSAFALVRIEVPYGELSFTKTADGFAAAFDVILQIFGRERLLTGDLWHEEIVVADRESLRGRTARYRRQFLFPLPPGNYTLEAVVSEPRSGHEGRLRLPLEIPLPLQADVRLSPLLLGPCGLQGRVSQLMFDERIGTDFADPPAELCAYAEVSHRDRQPEALTLAWRLRRTGGGDVLADSSFAQPAGAGVTRLSWPLPLGELMLATYELEVEVTIGEEKLQASAVFGILVESDLALGPFFRDMLGALAYLASEEELQRLSMAAPQDRRAVWDAFWERRDPTPTTERNEFKEDFFARLRYVNAEFGATRAGWRSDRGRIYLQYGPPEQIERYPFRSQGDPTEIWYYDRLGYRFVFVDRAGFGDYVLVAEDATGGGR